MVKNTSKVIFQSYLFLYFIVINFNFDYKNFFKKYNNDKSQKFKDIILSFKHMETVRNLKKKSKILNLN